MACCWVNPGPFMAVNSGRFHVPSPSRNHPAAHAHHTYPTFYNTPSPKTAPQIAARGAFRDAMGKCGARLLEPVMKVEVITPEDHMGDVIGDLNSRRGMVRGRWCCCLRAVCESACGAAGRGSLGLRRARQRLAASRQPRRPAAPRPLPCLAPMPPSTHILSLTRAVPPL